LSYEADGVFLPVEANDMRADEMGDTFVDERFESRWASRSIRR
jgi:hypothetical protein